MSDYDIDYTEVEKKRPVEWAVKKGHLSKKGLMSVSFQVADTLYRWSENEYHYMDNPLLLSEEDFDAAMVASSKYPAVEPHEAAITPRARSLRAKKDN